MINTDILSLTNIHLSDNFLSSYKRSFFLLLLSNILMIRSFLPNVPFSNNYDWTEIICSLPY